MTSYEEMTAKYRYVPMPKAIQGIELRIASVNNCLASFGYPILDDCEITSEARKSFQQAYADFKGMKLTFENVEIMVKISGDWIETVYNRDSGILSEIAFCGGFVWKNYHEENENPIRQTVLRQIAMGFEYPGKVLFALVKPLIVKYETDENDMIKITFNREIFSF